MAVLVRDGQVRKGVGPGVRILFPALRGGRDLADHHLRSALDSAVEGQRQRIGPRAVGVVVVQPGLGHDDLRAADVGDCGRVDGVEGSVRLHVVRVGDLVVQVLDGRAVDGDLAGDVGVPFARIRLILREVLKGIGPVVPGVERCARAGDARDGFQRARVVRVAVEPDDDLQPLLHRDLVPDLGHGELSHLLVADSEALRGVVGIVRLALAALVAVWDGLLPDGVEDLPALCIVAGQRVSVGVLRKGVFPLPSPAGEQVRDAAGERVGNRVAVDLLPVGAEEDEGDGVRALLRVRAAVDPDLGHGDFDVLLQGVGDLHLSILRNAVRRDVARGVLRIRVGRARRCIRGEHAFPIQPRLRHAVGIAVAVRIRIGQAGVGAGPDVVVLLPFRLLHIRDQLPVGIGVYFALQDEGEILRAGAVVVAVVLPGLGDLDGGLADIADGGAVRGIRVVDAVAVVPLRGFAGVVGVEFAVGVVLGEVLEGVAAVACKVYCRNFFILIWVFLLRICRAVELDRHRLNLVRRVLHMPVLGHGEVHGLDVRECVCVHISIGRLFHALLDVSGRHAFHDAVLGFAVYQHAAGQGDGQVLPDGVPGFVLVVGPGGGVRFAVDGHGAERLPRIRPDLVFQGQDDRRMLAIRFLGVPLFQCADLRRLQSVGGRPAGGNRHAGRAAGVGGGGVGSVICHFVGAMEDVPSIAEIFVTDSAIRRGVAVLELHGAVGDLLSVFVHRRQAGDGRRNRFLVVRAVEGHDQVLLRISVVRLDAGPGCPVVAALLDEEADLPIVPRAVRIRAGAVGVAMVPFPNLGHGQVLRLEAVGVGVVSAGDFIRRGEGRAHIDRVGIAIRVNFHFVRLLPILPLRLHDAVFEGNNA